MVRHRYIGLFTKEEYDLVQKIFGTSGAAATLRAAVEDVLRRHAGTGTPEGIAKARPRPSPTMATVGRTTPPTVGTQKGETPPAKDPSSPSIVPSS